MEELLALAFQFLLELVINVLSHLPIDWPSKKRRTPERENLWGLGLLWLTGGGIVGGLSLLFFDYVLLQAGWLRFANLLVSPVLSGLLAQFVAARRTRQNPWLVPRNHFWYGFWFSFGVAFVRFAYADRI